MSGGAVTSACALYRVSAEKHMSWPWCRLGRSAAPLLSCTVPTLQSGPVAIGFVPRELSFSWCLLHFILKKARKCPVCNTSRLSVEPERRHECRISEVKSVEVRREAELSKPSVGPVICRQAVALTEHVGALPSCFFFFFFFTFVCGMNVLCIQEYFLGISACLRSLDDGCLEGGEMEGWEGGLLRLQQVFFSRISKRFDKNGLRNIFSLNMKTKD